MEKLFLPKGALIQGERISVSHDGDIQIENNLVPLSIKSSQGSIVFIPESQNVTCSHLLAENGQVSLSAEKVDAELISAKEITMQVESLEVSQAIQAQESLELDGRDLKVGEIRSGDVSMTLKGNLELSSIEATGELIIACGSLKAKEIKAASVKLDVGGKLECEKLVSEGEVEVVNGSIAVKFLDCQSFNASPRVTGIILVATPEHVKAEGVRGFIRPQEFQAFSSNDSFLQLEAGSESDASDVSDAGAFEPEVVSSESVAEEQDEDEPELNEGQTEFETIDVEEAENQIHEGLDAEEDQDLAAGDDDALEEEEPPLPSAQFDEPPPIPQVDDDLPQPPPFPAEGEDLQTDEVDATPVDAEGEHQSLDDIALETLNMDDEEEGFDEAEEAIDMDTISEEQAMSITEIEDNESPGEAEHSLDSLDQLSDEDELDMDAIQLDSEKSDDSDWPEDVETAFPLNEEGAPIPEESDEFKTTELNFPESEAVEISDDYAVEDLSFGPNSFNLDEIQEAEPTPDFDSEELLAEQEAVTEDDLVKNLEGTIGEIKDCFPDENYPKFISQIEVYLQERRFQILRKKRNREAVVSSFDRLANPKISELARAFYEELTTYFNDEM